MIDLKDLLKRFKAKQITQSEERYLFDWLENFEHPNARHLTDEEVDSSLRRFRRRFRLEVEKNTLMPYYSVAAAVLVALLSVGSLLFWRSSQQNEQNVLNSKNLACDTRAKLIFNDGRELVVDDEVDALNLNELDLSTVKDSIWNLMKSRNFSDNTESDKPVFCSLKTAQGQTVKLRLSDGTLLTLNSSTKILFPKTFSGLVDRKISVEGEVYLEVAYDADRPFIVESGNQSIKVLGTIFNINSYIKSKQKTTLLKGKVEVSINTPSGIKKVLLNPGEQSISNSKQVFKHLVNLEKELDWQKHIFYFENSTIQEVMEEICNWYGMNYSIEPTVNRLKVNGIISRKRSVQDVLNQIEKLDRVKFEIHDKQIRVR